MKLCTYCKLVTECDCPIVKTYKSKSGLGKGPLKDHIKECIIPEGIVFQSIKTNIHQDCLIEMMEKILVKE